MKTLKTIKCWGIPFGKGTEITIEYQCKSIENFKDTCKKEGHVLVNEPYVAK